MVNDYEAHEESANVEPLAEKEPIENARHKLNDWDVSPDCLSIELPCGYIKNDKVYYEILVDEMTGREENLMAAAGPALPRINKILSNCISSIGGLDNQRDISDAVNNFTSTDREAALIALRRMSLGDIYSLRVRCPKCQAENSFDVDLKDVKITSMKDRMEREFTTELKSGRKAAMVEWHVMTAQDEEWLSTIRRKKRDKLLTLGFLSRVDKLNGVELKRRTDRDVRRSIEALEALTKRQCDELRKEMNMREGGVETEVEFECTDCGKVWEADMGVGGTSFFFPSE